jgi:hypothetical protein
MIIPDALTYKDCKPVFPEISTVFSLPSFRVETYVRIRKGVRGKYYLCRIFREVECINGYEPILAYKETMGRFIKDIYNCILFSKIDSKIVDTTGNPIFFLDEDQTPERERITTKTLFKHRGN